ncbi:MAG: GNAT family N-acetyltransferase, partial [Firmicutes bacterium]|nr:GNAT family N-acetyltransferase [Bacillota bacterium]
LTYNAMNQITQEEMLKSIQKSNENEFYMVHKDTNHVIGAIFIVEDELRYQVNSVCLAYYLSEKYIQQGYMTEALTSMIEYLFETGIDIISARTFKENKASSALLRKLGFVHEGTIRKAVLGYNNIVYDDEIFSITKEDLNK